MQDKITDSVIPLLRDILDNTIMADSAVDVGMYQVCSITVQAIYLNPDP
jgi:hypothetical protein